jgi:predicted glycosyltransferase
VYGDRAVFDSAREYGWSGHLARKVRHTGYLDRRPGAAAQGTVDPVDGLALPPGRLMLCMAGGGQDGADLMAALVKADLPAGSNCVALTGPFMPVATKEALAARAAHDPRFKVIEFLPEPTGLLERADRVIAMGGYNTVSEILSFDKPALIVPRVKPRQEQFIRARRMEKLGRVDVLHPRDLRPAALSAWLAADLRAATTTRAAIDFDGLSRLPGFLSHLLRAPAARNRVEADRPAGRPMERACIPAGSNGGSMR